MDAERVVIDTERVIEEVRARPEIWDPTHDLYKSREARQQAWAAASRALVEHLVDLDRVDQRDIEKKIQQRWRTARDCFVKARAQQLNGGAAAGGKDRSYGYYDAMTFLEPTLRLPLRVQRAYSSAGVGKRRRARAALADPVAPPPAAAAAAAAELSPLERKLVALVKTRASPLEEDDDDFFKSLAPLLRAFDTHQKLVFRSRVLALALDVQAAGAAAADPLDEKYLPPPRDYHDS